MQTNLRLTRAGLKSVWDFSSPVHSGTLIIAACAAVMTVTTALAEQLSIADLVNRLQPSVVNITITRNMKTQATGGNIITQDKIEEKKVQSSGFFINSSGVILTNHHVIADANSMRHSTSATLADPY